MTAADQAGEQPELLPGMVRAGVKQAQAKARATRERKAAGAAILGATLLGTMGVGAAMAADAPADAPAAAAAHAAAPDYTVRPGDSLWKISERAGLDFHALVAANPQFAKPDRIFPGDPVYFPSGAADASPPAAEAAPSAAEAAPTPPPTAGAAAPAGGDAAVDGTRTPHPGGPDTETPGILQRFGREARKLAFDLLVDQDLDVERTLPFGELFDAKVEVDQMFVDSASGDWERMAFARSLESDGKEAVWLSSAGRLQIDGAHAAEAWGLEGSARVGYSMVRPYVYTEDRPEPLAAAWGLVENNYRLPLSADAVEALDRGSAFTLRAAAELDAEGKLSFADVSADVEADLELRVRRLADAGVEVRYTRNASLDARMSAKDLREGLDLDLDFEAGRQRSQTFRLDLSEPAARRAYDALMSLDATRAAAIAEGSDAVRVTYEDDEASRGVEGQARFRPDATLDARLTAGVSRARDGEEVTNTIEGGADVTVRPEGSTGPTRFELSGARVTEGDERRVDVEGGVSGRRALGEDTDLELSVTAERGHRVDERRETERRTGRLAHGGALTTELLADGDHPVSLGFDADVEVRYTFDAPLGHDGGVPLTGASMRATPEGARLVLQGEGRLGFDAARGIEGLDLAVNMAAAGDVSFDARRLGDDRVQVDLRLERTLERGGDLGYDHDVEDGGRYRFSLSTETERAAEQRASFTLSLDEPSHRAAYTALVKGNLGPATRVTGVQAPSWVRRVDRAQDVTLSAAPFEWFDAGLELTRRDIDPSDARIRWSADRRALTDSLQAEGREVRWIEGEGALAPKLRLSNTVPVGAGVVSWRHGFAADKLVRYRAFAPRVDGEAPTLWPAMDAGAALALPRGAEFELAGRGKLSGFTGVGAGYEWGTTAFEASVSLAFDTTHSAERSWDVEVRRTEGSGVEVSFEEGRGRKHAFELAARAGVQIDSAALLGLDSAIDQVALLEKATDALDEEAEARLGFELEHSWSQTTGRSERLTFALDLDRPGAARAYEEMVRLDLGEALRLVGDPDSGVRLERGRTTDTTQTRRHTHLDAFGERLFLLDALRQDSTTIERWDGGTKRTDRSTFEKSYDGVFGREQQVRWEAVRVRTDDAPVGEGYYRLRLSDEDPRTGKDEVRRLVRLGQTLDAEPARPLRIEEGARGLNRLLGRFARHGETKLEMDVFFTGDGIEALREADASRAIQAYGASAAHLNRDALYGWARPEHTAEAVRILDAYFAVKDDPFGDDKDKRQEARSLEVEYWRLTGRELWEDDDAYRGARAFGDMVARMAASADPAEWNRAFADLGQDIGFDVHDAVGALQTLAGRDQLLVHRLEMKGDAVDIEMKDEGLLRTPS